MRKRAWHFRERAYCPAVQCCSKFNASVIVLIFFTYNAHQLHFQVCLRSSPLYYPGAVGFLTLNGQPKVGELLEQAWTITEKCRFKILKNGKKDREGEATAKVTEKSEYGEPTEISKSKEQ